MVMLLRPDLTNSFVVTNSTEPNPRQSVCAGMLRTLNIGYPLATSLPPILSVRDVDEERHLESDWKRNAQMAANASGRKRKADHLAQSDGANAPAHSGLVEGRQRTLHFFDASFEVRSFYVSMHAHPHLQRAIRYWICRRVIVN